MDYNYQYINFLNTMCKYDFVLKHRIHIYIFLLEISMKIFNSMCFIAIILIYNNNNLFLLQSTDVIYISSVCS